MDDVNSLVAGWRPIAPALAESWKRAVPFPFVVIDDFLPAPTIDALLEAFPGPEKPGWDGKAYLHQQNKLTRTNSFPEPIAEFFKLTAAEPFRFFLSEITGIPKLLDDPDLVGGGCHQILRGGFLDVHVDFNFHPTKKIHRRLNLLVYLNKGWKPEWGGSLELWDMAGKKKVHEVPPLFNRAVLFETSEDSYHGHPTPLNCPPDVSRKSLAVYYYTAELDQKRTAVEHNTLYRQTTGASGMVKTAMAAVSAGRERLATDGVVPLVRESAKKVSRKVRGLPPENR